MLQISIKAVEIFHLGGFTVTNSLLFAFLILIFLVIMGFVLRRKLSLVPKGFQNLIEMVIEAGLDLMDSVLGSRKRSEEYFPLVFTIFLFVLFSNWLGLVPGVGSVVLNQAGGGTVPLLRSPSSDLNFTIALALIAVTFVNAIGVSVVGIKSRVSVFLNFESPVTFFTGILELISEFAKIISFSFRLFGNVFGGEVLLAILAFLVPYLAPAPFMILELFFGFIQAFIFAMLTLIFIVTAISHEEEAHVVHQEA